MKRILTALALVMAMFAPSIAAAQTSLFAPETQVRESGVLTTSDVLGTTFTIPSNAKAVHVYANYTAGSLTSADFAPAGAMSDNPAASGYYKAIDSIQNVTSTGRFHWRIPRESFGAYRYGGIFAKGTGTATGSNALLYIKFEL